MVAVEEVLWNIFTYYSLNGNPRDPSKLHSTALVKLCRDVMAMDATMTEQALTLADLHLIYTSATKSPEKNHPTKSSEKADKIDFEAFLTCLIRIARKCYPSCQSKEEAMQQLLMDNILPMASRRKPVSISLLLKQSAIESLFKYYEDALKELYKFYTISSHLNNKNKELMRSTTRINDTFDDQRDAFEEAKIKANKEGSHHSHQMCYNDFIRFANDFGMVSSLGITTLDLGDIYLTVTFFTNFCPKVRKIDFKEFWEALVRCALVAFQDKKSLTTDTKIKGLFLSIWRHIQSSAQDHMNGYGTLQGGGFNTYKGALLRGTQLLNEKFVAAWTKDDYRDYLADLVLPSPQASPVKGVPFGKAMPPPPPTEIVPSGSITKILRGSNADLSPARDRANSRGMRSRAPTFAPTNNESTAIDAVTADKLTQIAVESVVQSDNFLVKVSDQGHIRVKISDYDDLQDERIKPHDLRQLLYSRPDIAEILYDALIDSNLVDDISSGQTGIDFNAGIRSRAMSSASAVGGNKMPSISENTLNQDDDDDEEVNAGGDDISDYESVHAVQTLDLDDFKLT